MTGSIDQEAGVILLAAQDLFSAAEQNKGNVDVEISYLQIYQRHVTDLLVDDERDINDLVCDMCNCYVRTCYASFAQQLLHLLVGCSPEGRLGRGGGLVVALHLEHARIHFIAEARGKKKGSGRQQTQLQLFSEPRSFDNKSHSVEWR